MAKAGLVDITTEMADQIRTTLEAVGHYEVQVEPRPVWNPTPLTIDIYPGNLARDADSQAFDEVSGGYLITVRARTNTPDSNSSIDLLLRLMDDTDALSLAEALLTDPTLNGYASSLDVRDFTGFRAYEHPSGEGAFLGFEFTTLVLWADS